MPVEPMQADRFSDMIKIAVVLERPSAEELAQYNRAEKYKVLQENTAKLRKQIIAWIEKQGLSEEVSQIGEPTAFNILDLFPNKLSSLYVVALWYTLDQKSAYLGYSPYSGTTLLFIVCTSKVVERLARAPGVIKVSSDAEFKVDLSRQAKTVRNPADLH